MITDFRQLFSRKRNTIQGIRAVNNFVSSAVSEACSEPAIALFGHLTTAGALLPTELASLIPREELRGRPPLRVPEGRMVPFVRAQLFVSLMAELEDMFGEVIRRLLLAFPGKITQKTVTVSDLLDAHAIGETVAQVTEVELSSLFYGGPQKLRERLEDVVSGPKLLESVWPDYVEMRARRDIGLHAGWKLNRLYLDKAGEKAAPERTKFLFPEQGYFESACVLATEVCDTLDAHCAAKFANCTPRHVLRELWNQSPLSRVMKYEAAWIDDETPCPSERALSWVWSGTEQLIYDFFLHIYNGDRNKFNAAQIFERWPGTGSSVVRSWLERPFYF
ncbi:MAG: hypothetical protein R3F14_11795 [Polyangiaceae bacterium]